MHTKPKRVEKDIGSAGGGTVDVVEELPPFPQPEGIFTRGTHFHPKQFLVTLEAMYDELVVREKSGGECSTEYGAFASMIVKRLTVTADDGPLFELYSVFQVPETDF
ncbi:uncharacterized protein FIBRA_08733 [Fibroporia radiculosa]|uniref:Uncharacterized protein n=1 Tax=Fibroporia radiculosa TaxID=599839 RepID=J4GI52_9APHY|nr:uncharacterized protein FIBRA_08733 [Fibroporia radiculosa]CCM06468.1 predicted protein [Fibroporia radiculosa]